MPFLSGLKKCQLTKRRHRPYIIGRLDRIKAWRTYGSSSWTSSSHTRNDDIFDRSSVLPRATACLLDLLAVSVGEFDCFAKIATEVQTTAIQQLGRAKMQTTSVGLCINHACFWLLLVCTNAVTNRTYSVAETDRVFPPESALSECATCNSRGKQRRQLICLSYLFV